MSRRFTLEQCQNVCFGGKAFFATPAFLGATEDNSGQSSSRQARRRRASPTSVVVGRHERLRSLVHKHVCESIELIRGKHDRIFLVSEHYNRTLLDVVRECAADNNNNKGDNNNNENFVVPEDRLLRYVSQIVDALDFLASNGIVHRNLHLNNILIDGEDNVKLSDYGLYYISNFGKEVPFFIGCAGYVAPEVILNSAKHASLGSSSVTSRSTTSAFKCDVWSLGVVILQMMKGEYVVATAGVGDLNSDAVDARQRVEHAIIDTFKLLGHDTAACDRHLSSVTQRLHERALRRSKNTPHVGDMIDFGDSASNSDDAAEPDAPHSPTPLHHLDHLEQNSSKLLNSLLEDCAYSSSAQSLVRECLRVASRRPDARQLRAHEALAPLLQARGVWRAQPVLRCTLSSSELSRLAAIPLSLNNEETWSLKDLFYFWKLAGGRVKAALAKKVRARPAIQRLPLIVRLRNDASCESSSSGATSPALDDTSNIPDSSTTDTLDSSQPTTTTPASTTDNDDDDDDGPDVVAAGTLRFRRNIYDDALLYDERIVPLPLDTLRSLLAFESTALSAANNAVSRAESKSKLNLFSVRVCFCSRLSHNVTPSTSSNSSSTSLPSTATISNTAAVAAALGRIEKQWIAARQVFIGQGNNLPNMAARRVDLDYQRIRLHIFRRLLDLYPSHPSRVMKAIVQQAKIDVPPLVRREVWAVLLNVDETAARALWAAFDHELPGAADHQIDLDIPRCHQYHPLLSSPAGHAQLRRILRCWVATNENELVYWQGLDSVLAPFVVLYFGDEAMAMACLDAFVKRHLRRVYRADNTVFLQETLLLFRQLLAYHDPKLAMHLQNIGFHPDLYAIPWFLTLFTHILPLDKCIPIWDALLVGRDALPQFVALSTMRQMRQLLLPLDFNQCIVLFSHLPEIDIEECLGDAMAMMNRTPGSIAISKFDDSMSDVSNSVASDRWWECRPPLEELRREVAPRISLHDMLSETQRAEGAVVIDVRSKEDFQTVHFPESVHFNTQKLEDSAVSKLERARGRPIVVVGDRSDDAFVFGSKLVAMGFYFVSVLHGGIDVLLADCGHLLVRKNQPNTATK